MQADFAPPAFQPQRPARPMHLALRGWQYHVHTWGDARLVTPERPALVLAHGFMDVGASFQFVVDALAALEGPVRYIVAPDWRGFGRSHGPAQDHYWFADYLGDLELLLDGLGLAPDGGPPIDLLGHSMGGNVVMSYAGARAARVRRLINLEGFGMPRTQPEQAPGRMAHWLTELKIEPSLRSYPDLAGVAARLRQTNPRLAPERAAWLASQWAEQRSDGRWHILADPAHRRTSALLYRVDETLAAWRAIQAPVLWVEGDETDTTQWWGHRYPREDFEARLAVVPQVQRLQLSPSGHMLHHEQPEALARALVDFLR